MNNNKPNALKTRNIQVEILRMIIICKNAFSFRGASPEPITRGSAPGTHWGLNPQTPLIGLQYCARHAHFFQLLDLSVYLWQVVCPCRGGLRSSTTSDLVIPRCRLSTYGSRAFSVDGPVCWTTLPEDYLKSPSDCFRQQLKHFYFADIDNTVKH